MCRLQSAESTCENVWCENTLYRLARGVAAGIGAALMTEYVPTRHKPMIMLVILNNQLRGGTQQSTATGEGAALD